jgi:hypothetical protein
MSSISPQKKVWVISILCFAVVTAVWLSQRDVIDTSAIYEKTNGLEPVEPLIAISNATNTDWEKILVSIKPEKTVDLTVDTGDDFDDTTITAQLSKDFFSQYLLLKKGGKEITAEDTAQIANNIVASGKYTDINAPIYVSKNLKIIPPDTEEVKKYRDSVNLSLKNRSSQIKTDPILILNKVIKSQDEKDLAELDPLIVIAKGFVNDFLNIPVPSDAVNVHLALLNSFSNLLSDMEGMRVILVDPIRSLTVVGKYSQHTTEFYAALNNMNAYFKAKGLR